MDLILEVISSNGQSLGPARRKVFGPQGGRIGRAPDCDWVLANPYISRHHATVRWISGTYYIESAGENGVAINTPQAMIPQRERRPLRNGDRLFLDEYEITVGVVVEAAAPVVSPTAGGLMSFVPGDDPLGDIAATAQVRAPDPLEPSNDELDPLKQLTGGQTNQPAPMPRPEPSWNHTPGLRDQFTPPAVSGGSIPDDWDKTSFGRGSAAALRADPPVAPPPASAAGVIPDDWDKTSFSRPAAPVPRPRGTPMPLRPTPPAPQPGAPPLSQQPMPHQAPMPQPAPQQPPVQPAPRQPSPAQQTATPSGALDLTSLLRAAGVDPATVPAETAASLGLILRTVVQGLIEVLQARAEIKDQFRLALTRIKTAENNPLKFAVDADDAMNSLLGRRNPAYLPPVDAFEDAFDDIRFHQMAMLAGMRAGFEHALQRFDPERLQEAFDKRTKRGGLLQMGAKSRYWEQYVEEFRDLTGDPEEAFRRLFGEEFASAYEKQLEELKRGRRKPPR